jgi:hypothetical protein
MDSRYYTITRLLKEKPETSSAGNLWTVTEEDKLIESIKNNTKITDIALEHKRTVNSIRKKLGHIAIKMMETEDKSMNDVCALLRITPADIKIKKSKETESETQLDLLKDIRNILIRIESKINTIN